MKIEANYTYILNLEKKIIYINDLNLGNKSVTNDIENVILSVEEDIINNIEKDIDFDIMNFNIIYKDSDNEWTGIHHYRRNDGSFSVTFYYIGGDNVEEAEKRIINWYFSSSPKIISFRFRGEPEMIHFIKTGWKDKYFVCQEDAYQIKPDGKDFLMTKEEIKQKFKIQL